LFARFYKKATPQVAIGYVWLRYVLFCCLGVSKDDVIKLLRGKWISNIFDSEVTEL